MTNEQLEKMASDLWPTARVCDVNKFIEIISEFGRTVRDSYESKARLDATIIKSLQRCRAALTELQLPSNILSDLEICVRDLNLGYSINPNAPMHIRFENHIEKLRSQIEGTK